MAETVYDYIFKFLEEIDKSDLENYSLIKDYDENYHEHLENSDNVIGDIILSIREILSDKNNLSSIEYINGLITEILEFEIDTSLDSNKELKYKLLFSAFSALEGEFKIRSLFILKEDFKYDIDIESLFAIEFPIFSSVCSSRWILDAKDFLGFDMLNSKIIKIFKDENMLDLNHKRSKEVSTRINELIQNKTLREIVLNKYGKDSDIWMDSIVDHVNSNLIITRDLDSIEIYLKFTDPKSINLVVSDYMSMYLFDYLIVLGLNPLKEKYDNEESVQQAFNIVEDILSFTTSFLTRK